MQIQNEITSEHIYHVIACLNPQKQMFGVVINLAKEIFRILDSKRVQCRYSENVLQENSCYKIGTAIARWKVVCFCNCAFIFSRCSF